MLLNLTSPIFVLQSSLWSYLTELIVIGYFAKLKMKSTLGLTQKHELLLSGVETMNQNWVYFCRANNCHRCIVINERHPNVLQYKESKCESTTQLYQFNWDKFIWASIGIHLGMYCEDEDTLENICSRITGDAQLYSLFRLDGTPEDCPFRFVSISKQSSINVCIEPHLELRSLCQQRCAVYFHLQPWLRRVQISTLTCRLMHWKLSSPSSLSSLPRGSQDWEHWWGISQSLVCIHSGESPELGLLDRELN